LPCAKGEREFHQEEEEQEEEATRFFYGSKTA
jgi:hypothetical protein